MTDQYSKLRDIAEIARDLFFFHLLALYYYAEAIFRYFVPPPFKSLAGEVILITGGANGIGKEIALQLAQAKCNAKIVIWDLDEKATKDLVKELQIQGCDAFGFKVDVSDRLAVESTASQMPKTVGGNVSILINNAGIMPCKSFFKHSPTELENVFKINVFGNFWTIRAFVPQMIESDRGHIVTLCSAAGLVGVRNLVPYCGTKHAVHGIIEGIKDEFRAMPHPPNIKFTTIYPYSCNTGLLTGIKSHSRFPWLVPTTLNPVQVASQVVEGLRRNYEHVYIPSFVQFAGTTAKGLIPKVQRAATDFVQCFVEPSK